MPGLPPLILSVQGFRSVRRQSLEIRPITLLYGPSGGGKSSFLYALAVLRNLLVNPNQHPSALFNLGSVHLGDLKSVLHRRNPGEGLGVALEVAEDWEKDDHTTLPSLYLHGALLQEPDQVTFRYRYTVISPNHPDPVLGQSLVASLPYPGNSVATTRLTFWGREVALRWNGLVWSPEDAPPSEIAEAVVGLLSRLNAPLERLRRTVLVPLARGFTKPQYQPTSFAGPPSREDEVATALAQSADLELKVGFYVEEITGYRLQVKTTLGTALFGLWAMDLESRVVHQLVNAGFGVNQTAYLLALALHGDTETLLVEEPEIHLHPTLMRRLAWALARIAREEGRRFVLSTHSEALVAAFLSLVARGELDPSELACYLVQKEAGETRVVPQRVNEEGQVEGGLLSFMEGELEDLRSLLGIDRE